MVYFFTFVTAVLTFVSPCVLPMLPVFITYFAASSSDDLEVEPVKVKEDSVVTSQDALATEEGAETMTETMTETVADETVAEVSEIDEGLKKRLIRKRSFKRTLINAVGFAIGLMAILVAISTIFGIVASSFSEQVDEYRWIINLVAGSIVIILGISFTGLIKIPFLNGGAHINVRTTNLRFFSSVLLGLAYGVSFGPCIATFGSFTFFQGIIDAVQYGEMFRAVALQLVFAGTLGALFIISALLIDFLKGFFSFIKKHYRVFNLVSGLILVVIGILMATSLLEKVIVAIK